MPSAGRKLPGSKICENEYGNARGDKSWTALFRVENWDDSKDVPYRVAHGETAIFEGLIRKNPVDKDEIVVAAFTGNSINPGHGGDISRRTSSTTSRRPMPTCCSSPATRSTTTRGTTRTG